MSRRNAILILVVGVLMFVAVVVVYFISQGGSDQAAPPPVDPTTGEVILGDDGEPIITEENPPAEANGTGVSELDMPDFQFGESSDGSIPDMVEVVVSLQTIPRGWQMTADELTVDMRPAENVGTNVITDVQKAIGLYARTDIY